MISALNRQQLLSGNRLILSVLLLVFSLSFSFGQSKKEFQKKYAASKDFFTSGDYGNAYEGFRLLTQSNSNNYFEEYAHYYTGYSAFKIGKFLDSKFILVNAIKKFPEWKQLYEVKFVLAQVAFYEKDYERAFQLCSEIIHENKVQEDVVKLLRKEVFGSHDLNVLLKHQINHPDNYSLAKAIADRIRFAGGGLAEKMLLQYFIQEYGLNPDNYKGVFTRPSIKKEIYNVAVLLPLNLGDKMNWSKSGKVFEMLEGIKLSIAELEKSTSSKFKVYSYDTQKDTAKVKELLNKPEMKQMDLIIGAYLNRTGVLVKNFAEVNQIHYVNPLNGDPALIGTYSTLFKPSYSEIGKQLAIAAVDSFPLRPEVGVFFSQSKRDSIIARSYKQTIEQLGRKVVVFQKVTRHEGDLMYSKINKLNLDSLGHIAVFNKEDLVATNFMSALEGRIASIEAAERKAAEEAEEPCECEPIYVPVIAPVEWLDVYIIQFEQFIRRSVHFYDVDFIDYNRKQPSLFRLKMKDRMGVSPSTSYSTVGYDLMLVYGNMLNKYGNSFVGESLDEAFVEGCNFEGSKNLESVSNSIVPLLKLDKEYHLQMLNKK